MKHDTFTYARTEPLTISPEDVATISAEPMKLVFHEVLEAVLNNSQMCAQLCCVPRWERYEIEPGASKLFQDTNLLGHTLATLHIAQRMTCLDLADNVITPRDAVSLWIVALIHDFGELAEGDVNFIKKQAGQDTVSTEQRFFHAMKKSFFLGIDPVNLDIVSRLYDEVAMARNRSSGLPLRFNQIEEVGYVMHALDMFESQPRQINWHMLCTSVMHYHLKSVQRYVAQHATTASILGERVMLLDRLIDYQEQNATFVASHLAQEFQFEGRQYAKSDCKLDIEAWRTIASIARQDSENKN